MAAVGVRLSDISEARYTATWMFALDQRRKADLNEVASGHGYFPP
jgi:hypothetical protein